MSEDIVVRLRGYDGLVQMSPMTTTEVVGACQEAASAIESLRAENARLKAALVRLRDCDWVISLPDRMDAVREIARNALEAKE